MPNLSMPATREEWLKLRRSFVGASESAVLLAQGASWATSPIALYHIKRGEKEEEDIGSNDRVKEGVRLEDDVARYASAHSNREIGSAIFAVHDDETLRMSASLDRVIYPNEKDWEQGRRGPGALECKIVGTDIYKKHWQVGPPPYYIIQNHHQMACSTFTWGVIAVGVQHVVTKQIIDFQWWDYDRDEQLVQAIEERVRGFWWMVDNDTPPGIIDGHKSTTAALKTVHQADRGTEIDLSGSNSLVSDFHRYMELTATEAAAKQEKQRIVNTFRNAMGTAQTARLGPGFYVKRSVTDDTPDREAMPGEIIKGRKGQDALRFSAPKEPAE